MIYIPSKNRVEAPLLKAVVGVENVIVVVEPQDYEKYKAAHPNLDIITLPENDKGIAYVRNYIKERAGSPYWQLDDDISGLFYREGTKMVRGGFEILDLAAKALAGCAVGALEYRQFAWSATRDMVENSFCDVCVYVDPHLTKGLQYREYVQGKEDRDFAMQAIRSGQKTGRTTLYAFSAPPNGSNKGGLKETFYDVNGREQECAKRMVELWGPHICHMIVKPGGRNDVKIMWNEINSQQTKLL